jgi:hypothetical protein
MMLESIPWWVWLISAPILFGIGFWGGIIQHSHLTIGEGGTLPSYFRYFFTSHTLVSVTNTIVQTTIASFTLPGNSISQNNRFVWEGLIGWINNTGVALNEPIIILKIGGQVVTQIGNTTAFATSPNERGGHFMLTLSQGPSSSILQGRSAWTDSINNTSGNPVLADRITSSLSVTPNFAIDNLIEINVLNVSANVNYTTNHRYSSFSMS